jgi:plasmid maintenance system antidote protein VapI
MTSHPGLSLQDWLDERGLTVESLADRESIRNHLRGFLAGRDRITPALAHFLERQGCGTAAFWRERQRQYETQK